MVSENTRRLVWERMIAAESRFVYYGSMADKLQFRERVAAFIVGLFSSVAFVNLVSKFTVPYLSEVLSFLSATAGLYVTLSRQGKGVDLAASLCRTWSEIQNDFELLWHELPRLDDEAALSRWRGIETKHYNADESAKAIKRNRKLMRKSQAQVFTTRGLNAAIPERTG